MPLDPAKGSTAAPWTHGRFSEKTMSSVSCISQVLTGISQVLTAISQVLTGISQVGWHGLMATPLSAFCPQQTAISQVPQCY